MDFFLVIFVVAIAVVIWVALVQRGRKQATEDELAGWSPRSRRRHRRRRSSRERSRREDEDEGT